MVTALNNQSLFDIAIQVYGSVAYVFELAVANGISITDELTAGQQIEVPEIEVESKGVQAYFLANQIKPATAIRPEDIALDATGNCDFCKLLQ